MAGIADLLFGPQTYAVPTPQTENLTSILSGAPAALTAQSQVPGAVAAAQTPQAQGPQEQEQGFLQKATGWLQANPVQAQALMQGFGAMASGRTNGNFLMQAGQAAGVGNQYMVEQNAANAQRDAAQAQLRDQNAGKMRDDVRQDRLADSSIETQAQQRKVSEDTLKTSAQNRRQDAMKFAPEMDKLKAQIGEIRERIATAGSEREVTKLKLDAAKLDYSFEQKYGDLDRQAKLEGAQAQTARYQEQGTQEILQTDAMVQKRADMATLTPAQRTGIKGMEGKTVDEIATQLVTKNPEIYTDRATGTLDVMRARQDAEMIKDPTKAKKNSPNTQARMAVKVGESYQGADGQWYKRKD